MALSVLILVMDFLRIRSGGKPIIGKDVPVFKTSATFTFPHRASCRWCNTVFNVGHSAAKIRPPMMASVRRKIADLSKNEV
jgi:hypothetical protein